MLAPSCLNAQICRLTRRRSNGDLACRYTISLTSWNGFTPGSGRAATPIESTQGACMTTRRSLAGALGAGAAVFSISTASAQNTPQSGESTYERVRRTGVLRIAALPGEQPFFRKDLATGEWRGVGIDMAKSIAGALSAKLEYVESTYSNSVLDLQSNKIDLAFALNPTPQRALAIGFTQPYYLHPFGYVARKGFAAKTWEDLNNPNVRVVSLIGSLTD